MSSSPHTSSLYPPKIQFQQIHRRYYNSGNALSMFLFKPMLILVVRYQIQLICAHAA